MTRFAKEVAGDPLIHFMGRGNDTQSIRSLTIRLRRISAEIRCRLPSGSAHRHALPVQSPPVGSRRGRIHGQVDSVGSRITVRRRATSCCATSASMTMRSMGMAVDKRRFSFEALTAMLDDEPLMRGDELGSSARRHTVVRATWAQALRRLPKPSSRRGPTRSAFSACAVTTNPHTRGPS